MSSLYKVGTILKPTLNYTSGLAVSDCLSRLRARFLNFDTIPLDVKPRAHFDSSHVVNYISSLNLIISDL